MSIRWLRLGVPVILGAMVVAAIAFHLSLRPPPTSFPGDSAEPCAADWFRDAKLGVMIHWGPASLLGTEVSWSRAASRPGEAGVGEVPREIYDNAYKRFNPTAFNARAWIRTIQAAGARYLVFVTKHHDGFCMFDSRLTDYKITNTPFGRDIFAEIATACHEAGLPLGVYYSQPDWRHPDYSPRDQSRYRPYLHDQVRELCTRYGAVRIVWFDGLHWRTQDWDTPNLFRMIRELQPGVLINDRAGCPADFGSVFNEGRVGEFATGAPWESAITLGTQWSYKPDDTLKSPTECLRSLVECAGKGGNLLLNISPMPSGTLEPRQVERLQQIGDWLRKYGSSLYGTRPGPLRPATWGVSTHRGRRVYLHVLDAQCTTLRLKPLPWTIRSARRLDGGAANVQQTREATVVELPLAPAEFDRVVELQLAGRPIGLLD